MYYISVLQNIFIFLNSHEYSITQVTRIFFTNIVEPLISQCSNRSDIQKSEIRGYRGYTGLTGNKYKQKFKLQCK